MQFQTNIPNPIPNNLKQLIKIIDNFYGDKAKRLAIILKENTLQYILFNAFEVKFQLGERYQEFGVGIVIGDVLLSSEILPNRKIIASSDEKTIIGNLELIEEYCKLRLPDKFLKYHGWE